MNFAAAKLWKPLIIIYLQFKKTHKYDQIKTIMTRNLADRTELTELIGDHFSTSASVTADQQTEKTVMKLVFKFHESLLPQVM